MESGKTKDLDLEGHVNSVLEEAVKSHEEECRERHAKQLNDFLEHREKFLLSEREQMSLTERKKQLGERLLRLHTQDRKFAFYENTSEVRRRVIDYKAKMLSKDKKSDTEVPLKADDLF